MKKVEEKPKTKLDYNAHMDDLPEGAFRISASQLNQFMDKPHLFYREKVLGESGFEGNTASVLGTIVHYIAECFTLNQKPDKAEIEQYIFNHKDNLDVDPLEVRRCYKEMGEALVNQYIMHEKPTHPELSIHTEIMPGYYAGCTIDGLYDNGLLIDYKTYNSKTKPKAIPMPYRYQLLENAFVAKAKGYLVDRIRLVYINRPIDGRYISEKTGKECGKIHPPEVTVLTECITAEDMEFIESILKLCAETLEAAKTNPELVHLLFRDYRLKL